MSVAMSTSVTGVDFDTITARTREILKNNGFGVLTEIDLQATLKAKLGEEMERYLILGACNPQLMAQVVDNPALAPIADEVTEKIQTVIDTLADALRTA